MKISRDPVEFPAQCLPYPIVAAEIESDDHLDIQALFVAQVSVGTVGRYAMQAVVRRSDREDPATAFEKLAAEFLPAFLADMRRGSDQRICFRQPFDTQMLYDQFHLSHS